MTYGWAILIIAIVMVAMFQLGIFNPSEPRVSAGACEVYRSAASSPTLTGECQGVLPEYVAQFNGQDSHIATTLLFPGGTTEESFSVSAWIYTTGICQIGNFYCGILDADNGVNGWGLEAGQTTADFWILSSNSGTVQDMMFNIPNRKQGVERPSDKEVQ